MPENGDKSNIYKDIYTFTDSQITKSREFFEKYFKITLWGFLLIATVSIGAFYWLVAQKYADIETKIETKMTLRTDEQITKLQEEIRKRLEEEFKTDKMRALIKTVAQEQTKLGLTDVINRAVIDQVTAAIKNENPKIQQTVIQETKKAVSNLSPIIETAVKEKVDQAEKRIKTNIGQSEELLQAGTLAILARNGSGEDLDKLMELGRTTQNPAIQKIAVTTHNELFLEMNSAMFIYMDRKFNENKTEQELLTLLDDPMPLARQAAIDELVKLGNKSIVPKLLEKAEHDPFMVVRRAAFRGLQVLTGEKIEPLNISAWKAWWAKKKDTWPKK